MNDTSKKHEILPSSKSTFEWYLDNLQRIGFYGISHDEHKKLNYALATINDILNSLPVSMEDN